MKVICPLCGNDMIVDVDLEEGQHVICATCEEVFDFKKEYAIVQSKRSRLQSVTCPHCGKVHEVDESRFGKYLMCSECDRVFPVRGPRLNRQSIRTKQQNKSAENKTKQHDSHGHKPGCLASVCGCLWKIIEFVFGLVLLGAIVIAGVKFGPVIWNKVTPSIRAQVQLNGPYFGLRLNQDIRGLPNSLFKTDEKGRRIVMSDEGYRFVTYRPPSKHRWFLDVMKTKEVSVSISKDGRAQQFICMDIREEKGKTSDYVARLTRMTEETYKEFQEVLAYFRNSQDWKINQSLSSRMSFFFDDDEGARANVYVQVFEGTTLLTVAISHR